MSAGGRPHPLPRRRLCAWTWLAVCACGPVAGCATQSAVRMAPPGSQSAGPLLVASRGIGFFGSDSGIGIGWRSELKLYLDRTTDDCRVIVVLQDVRLLAALQEWLQAAGSGLDRICIGVEGGSR